MPLFDATDKAVLQTIIYFDLFDFPLTKEELHRNIIANYAVSIAAIENRLKNNNMKSLIEKSEGFYYLKNRGELISKRKANYLLTDKKFKVAINNAKLLRLCHGVKAIFITNKLAYSNPRENGDIDIAIITSKNKLWTARFFTSLLMKILGRRPQKHNQKNKICLSFYLTENNLNLNKWLKPNDLHLAMWLSQFVPIYDPENLGERMLGENKWIRQMLPNAQQYNLNDRRKVKATILSKFLGGILFFIPENTLKSVQIKLLAPELKQKKNDSNGDVIINDKILKLHSTDRRQYYNDNLKDRCKELIPAFVLSDLIKLVQKK